MILLVFCFMVACGNQAAPAAPAPAEDNTAPKAQSEGPASSGGDSEVWRVGATVLTMSNPIWSQFIEYTNKHMAEHNFEFTWVSAEENPSKQVEQIENFITSGVDALFIWAVDGTALDDVVDRALDAGIFVVNQQAGSKNYSALLDADEHAIGYAVGTNAANYINDVLGGEAKYGVIAYDISEIYIFRGNGMRDAVLDMCPNAEKVIQAIASATTVEGMANGEDFLQAYPDLDVIVCVNDATAIGAMESAKSKGVKDTFALFGCDATQEALQNMKDGTYFKGTVSLGGAPALVDDMLFPVLNLARAGKEYPKVQYFPTDIVTLDNYMEFVDLYGYTLK